MKLTLTQRNERFNKLPDHKKRVAIAQDVIKQIKSKTYVATSGTWANLEFPELEKVTQRTSIQELMHTEKTTCHVCGIGAILSSAVFLGNNCTVQDSQYSENKKESYKGITRVSLSLGKNHRLVKYFSHKQIRLIELAFEIGDGAYVAWTDQEDKAVKFGEKYKTNKGRMVGIMTNIIKNKGEFKP